MADRASRYQKAHANGRAHHAYTRVSAGDPCPICGKPDWCTIRDDRRWCHCSRIDQGAVRTHTNANGEPYHVHRLSGETSERMPPPPPPSGEARRADPATLDRAYDALLARLTLAEADRKALLARGLTDEAIDRGQYRTLPVQGRAAKARAVRESIGDDVLCVPGFVVKEGQSGPYLTLAGAAGLVIPCRDPGGPIRALKIRRKDVAGDKAENANRYTYMSSSGYGGPTAATLAHVPIGTPPTAELVRVTEAELKADVCWVLTGVPTIGCPGASAWRLALGVLAKMECKTVRLAFDADAWSKKHVARSLSAFADALYEAGYSVELERWGAEKGKGLDDLLAAGGKPEVLTGDAVDDAIAEALASAGADGEEEDDELARLHEVLARGGAEALFSDKALMQALADLADNDPARYAAVRASIRERVRLRDLDAALRPFRRQETPSPAAAAKAYHVVDGCICRTMPTRDGPLVLPLTNFTARLVEDVVVDDGAEQSRRLAVTGTLADGTPLPRADVPAADFARMEWPVTAWGTQAVVYAGAGTRDHLRVALQLLSGAIPRRTIYRHTGWREIGGRWFYLHAGGAIGADGLNAQVPVELEMLSGYLLPAPPEGEALRQAIRASLRLLDLGHDRLTVPLLAAVYRAVLGDTDFGLHLSGPTGCFKSEAAALAQQHFGAGLDARHLPGSWSSTANSLEGLAFTAKDALLVVDDFAPTGSTANVHRNHCEADRLLRAQGNHSGRQRSRIDGTVRPSRPPRGLVLSTGEDIPRGASLRARLLVIEVSPGDFGPAPPSPNMMLTACQRDAAAGLYAAAMAGYLRWLAPHYADVRSRLRTETAELRDRARSDGQHARTPGIVADLALGLRYFLDFAWQAGAIIEQERSILWEDGWAALIEAGAAQADHVASADPVDHFLRLLNAAVASGTAHLAGENGREPHCPQRWGWRGQAFGSGENQSMEWKAQGQRIGWATREGTYLEPEASYAAVQALAREQGEALAISARTLRRRLNERGYLAETGEEQGRETLTVRKSLEGKRREVLSIRSPEIVAPAEEDGDVIPP